MLLTPILNTVIAVKYSHCSSDKEFVTWFDAFITNGLTKQSKVILSVQLLVILYRKHHYEVPVVSILQCLHPPFYLTSSL